MSSELLTDTSLLKTIKYMIKSLDFEINIIYTHIAYFHFQCILVFIIKRWKETILVSLTPISNNN